MVRVPQEGTVLKGNELFANKSNDENQMDRNDQENQSWKQITCWFGGENYFPVGQKIVPMLSNYPSRKCATNYEQLQAQSRQIQSRVGSSEFESSYCEQRYEFIILFSDWPYSSGS